MLLVDLFKLRARLEAEILLRCYDSASSLEPRSDGIFGNHTFHSKSNILSQAPQFFLGLSQIDGSEVLEFLFIMRDRGIRFCVATSE